MLKQLDLIYFVRIAPITYNIRRADFLLAVLSKISRNRNVLNRTLFLYRHVSLTIS